MCPSYMATREEKHSTRGRARLLFEMLRGEVDTRRLARRAGASEALDLCLACKGCKSDCPVNVDMATYKAEFLSHYYARRLRPRAAYAMGLIYWWARAETKLPRLVNAVTHAPGLSWMVKRAGGVAVERTVPRFATTTFTDSFRARTPTATAARPGHDGTAAITHAEVPRFARPTYSTESMQRGSGRNELHPHGRDAPFATDRVLLWPDTFNNYLESDVLHDAAAVLEHAGYIVEIPPRPLCCGRPLYDWGMLDTAERLWRQTLDTLRPWIRAGVPVVGLEPSCVAAFRDELVNLFPDDDDARRLSDQTLLFSEFLERQRYQPPPLSLDAVVHGHCHHQAVLGMDAELALLSRMGVDTEVLDSGCCGMAGSFGFDADNYEVSVRVGERVLLPAARDLDADQMLITDGFSCRQQVEQETGVEPVHIATLVRRAIDGAV